MKQTDELKQTTEEMDQAAQQPAAEKPAAEGKPNPDDLPVYLYKQGNNFEAQRFFGSHLEEQGGEKGVMFRLWAPHATAVSVVGDFNSWKPGSHPMKKIDGASIWELFIPGMKEYDVYKYAVVTRAGDLVHKADPYALHAETRPSNGSKVYDLSGFGWTDAAWQEAQKAKDFINSPMNIYEMHAGSWKMKQKEDGTYVPYNYSELADLLIPYGTPKALMAFGDKRHGAGSGVIMDWVPAHFPKDQFGLYMFDGEPCYEDPNPRRGEHKEWGTMVFNFGMNEVQSFLISSALYWLEQYHIDGLRVDAVASMLYLDYNRRDGEWEQNIHGGKENLEAIAFLQKLNTAVLTRHPEKYMIAEESTAWPNVTKPASEGGWELLDYDKHKQLQQYVKTLNQFYKDHPAFWQVDYSWEGFQWIVPDDYQQSVVAFLRKDAAGKQIMIVCNFTPVLRESYIMGAPVAGSYKELLNSDDAAFGGSGLHHNKNVRSKKVPMHGFDQSITITLPPLSAVYFEVPAPRAAKPKAAADKAETKTTAKKTATRKAAGEKKTTTARRTTKSKVEKGAASKETKAAKAEKAEKKAPAKQGGKPKAEKPAEE